MRTELYGGVYHIFNFIYFIINFPPYIYKIITQTQNSVNRIFYFLPQLFHGREFGRSIIMQTQRYILIKSIYTLENTEHTIYGIALADGSDLIESVNGLSCDRHSLC